MFPYLNLDKKEPILEQIVEENEESEENKDKILSKAINSHLSRRTKSLTFKNKSNLTHFIIFKKRRKSNTS